MSKTTKKADLTTKKDIYERTLKTHEYFCYDPDTRELFGWRLNGIYKTIDPNERGWLWSKELGLWLGVWQGEYLGYNLPWLRFFDADGTPVSTFSEAAQQHADAMRQRADAMQQHADAMQQRADAMQQRAEAEKQRADALAAELAQLKAQFPPKQ